MYMYTTVTTAAAAAEDAQSFTTQADRPSNINTILRYNDTILTQFIK